MASLNKALIIGHLGKDPEARYLPNGDAVSNFSVATSEQWKDKSGEKKEQTEWHRISAFGKLAEICNQYLKKGSLVYIEGRIQTRKWQDKDGQDRYTTEIKADVMRMLGGRQESSAPQSKQENQSKPSAGNYDGGGSFNDFDDDIPFLFNMNTLCDTMGKPLSLWRAKHGKGLSVLRANKTDF